MSQNKLTIKNSYYRLADVEDAVQAERNPDSALDIGIFDIARLFLKRRKSIAAIVGIVTFAAMVIALLTPNKYASTASILPTGATDKMAALKDLAGFGSTSSQDENSSELYPVILQSRAILEGVADRRYKIRQGSETESLTLGEYFKSPNPDRLYSMLSSITAITTDKNTGVITLGVETTNPELSQAIAREYLAQLEDFNLHRRNTRGRQNADYLARQVAESETELAAAEENLRTYQKANRDWYKSTYPDIVARLTHLQREVEIKSKKYLYFTQEYEAAKVEARKDVPIVSVLDQPNLPRTKSGPRRMIITIMAFLTSLLGTLVVILIIEVYLRKSHGPERQSYEAFREELRTVRVFNRILKSRELTKTMVDQRS